MSSFLKITESALFSTDLQKEAEAYAEEKRKNNWIVKFELLNSDAFEVKSEFRVLWDKAGEHHDDQ